MSTQTPSKVYLTNFLGASQTNQTDYRGYLLELLVSKKCGILPSSHDALTWPMAVLPTPMWMEQEQM